MQVCVPTTPSQMFHLLRRQMLRTVRKPLIVMTPKSALRHKKAVSTLDEIASGSFQEIIVDDNNAKNVDRVVICSGKVYYELLAKQEEHGLDNVVLIRIEQLYPFPEKALSAVLAKYKKVKDVIWCQEEPKTQGAWYRTKDLLQESLAIGQTLTYAGHPAAAAPAAGYLSVHMQRQNKLINEALGIVEK